MDKLAVIDKHAFNQRNMSLSVIIAMFLVGLIVVTFIISLSIELSLQQKIDLVELKQVLGDKGNDQGKQMKILPCDREHECQTSI